MCHGVYLVVVCHCYVVCLTVMVDLCVSWCVLGCCVSLLCCVSDSHGWLVSDMVCTCCLVCVIVVVCHCCVVCHCVLWLPCRGDTIQMCEHPGSSGDEN